VRGARTMGTASPPVKHRPVFRRLVVHCLRRIAESAAKEQQTLSARDRATPRAGISAPGMWQILGPLRTSPAPRNDRPEVQTEAVTAPRRQDGRSYPSATLCWARCSRTWTSPEWSQPLPPRAAAALNNSCVVAVFGSDRLSARAPARARLRSF